jgi:integrase
MKHLTKQPFISRGCLVFCLIDDEGDVVGAFEHFVDALFKREYAFASIKRYMEVVGNFIDYLIETGVFGKAVTAERLNHAIDSYLSIRVRADRICAAPDNSDDNFIRWAKPIVVALRLRSVQVNENLAAPINLFLRLSETLARTEWERVEYLGLESLPENYHDAIRAVEGHQTLTQPQRKALKQSSMLSNVMRLNPDGIARPRGLVRPNVQNDGPTLERRDFPLTQLAPVIRAARTERDKSLWLLLASSVLRTSEALALRWEHIDPKAATVYVEDPNNLRYANELPLAARMRFKGRAVSETYLIQPLRDQFFEALAKYLKDEYVPGSGHNFVFQDTRIGPLCGRPMHEMSDTARSQTFKRAVRRAGVPSPSPESDWTLHALRHAYGVYLLNYLPVPGGYGLALKEVQRLMGHKSEATTSNYAREDSIILAAKLEYSDRMVISLSSEWTGLPALIAQRLRHEASRYENGLMT